MAPRLETRRALRAEVAWAAAASVLALVLAAIALELWDADWRVPWSYTGDANLNQMVVKGVLEHGWYQHNPDLAAPFGQSLLDFPFVSGDNLQIVLMKTIGIFSSDSALVMNLFFLLTFPLTVVCAFAAARMLDISRPPSALVAVLYALLPFHFIRGEFHLFIAAYYAVPLGAYLILAVLTDRRPRVAVVAVFAVIVGSAHVYYAAFALIVLAVAVLLQALARRREAATGGVLAIALIGAVVVVNHLPNAIHQIKHGANPALERQAEESEAYGLKPVQMVLPVEGHRLKPLAKLRERYTEHSGSQLQEGQSQALGVIATAGLLGLLLAALMALGPGWTRRSGLALPLSGATLMSLLLGTVGGGSALIAYLLTPQLRAWGRISVLIAFFGLLAVAMAVERLHASRRGRSGWAVLALLLVVGFLDQTNARSVPDYRGIAATYRTEAAFVDGIERALPPRSAVFQLPYEPFPEPQPAWVPQGMGPYDMARPYLHSRDLRWSYGLMKGRAGDWQAALVQLPPELTARAVAAVGFRGLFVDRFGFADRGAHLLERLVRETGGAVAGSGDSDQRLAFIDLRDYAARLRAEHAGDLPALRAAALRPVTVQYGTGFSALRQSAEGRTFLTGTSASATFHNPSARPRRATFTATLVPAYPAPAEVRLTVAGRSQTLSVPAAGRRVELPLTLAPGATRLSIAARATAQYGFPQVTRPFYLRVRDPVLVDSAFEPLGPLPRDRRAAAFLSPFGAI